MTQDKTPQYIKLDERNHVEKPLLDQLDGLDWEIIDLDSKQHPGDSHRQNFTEVVMLPVLRAQLKIINPWLADDQVEEVVKQLTAGFPGTDLIKNNCHVFTLLLENTSVSENRRTGEKSPTVRFVDFTHRDHNRFIAVCQPKVRYQQFRAVKLAVRRLLAGQNPRERSGIIWHTQGSGKSLTMMFMVREMYRHAQLSHWKVVFVTDRTQLEGQLSETSRSIGFTVKVADSIRKLKELLRSDSSDLIMAMIHKFREADLSETFPELNDSSHILVMTDEAHRSQYAMLGANLDKGIPNAARIGYTGTPIDKTERVFGDYIDKYTMRQSIDDGVTLEIVYEGRTHNAEVVKTGLAEVRFVQRFLVPAIRGEKRVEALREWYIGRAKEKIVPRVKGHARELGANVAGIKIVDSHYRWGSCTVNNKVGLNWRLIKAPMFVIDYIIVHELAHLIEANHTPRFWNIVRAQAPTMDKAKAWLKENGQLLEEAI